MAKVLNQGLKPAVVASLIEALKEAYFPDDRESMASPGSDKLIKLGNHQYKSTLLGPNSQDRIKEIRKLMILRGAEEASRISAIKSLSSR